MRKTILVVLLVALAFTPLGCQRAEPVDLQPKYGEKEIEMRLAPEIEALATCRIDGWHLPWCVEAKDADLLIIGQRKARDVFCSLRRAPWTLELYKVAYEVSSTERFPHDEVSFFYMEPLQDGCMYKLLGAPETAELYLRQRQDEWFLVSIQPVTPKK